LADKTLLIVDDSQIVRSSVKAAVTRAGLFQNIFEADNGAEALRLFALNKVTFIITDIEMPILDGYKLLAAIREMDTGHDIPVIMLTAGRKNYSDKIKGLTMGASDYVIKPFDEGEFIARIKVFLRIHELQEELKAKNALLERMATTDDLTGIPNRRYFFEAVKGLLALSKRNALPIACLLIDIDFFKKVNDSYGHQAGDEVLKNVAELMFKNRREGEHLARLGGEEFVVCLFKAGEEGAFSAGERFRKAVEVAKMPLSCGDVISISVSIGCSSMPSRELKDFDGLLSMADKALYCAKKNGRNRTETFMGIKSFPA
jgi:diguanylate cyclase (GGDEF)-like protein